MSWNFAVFHTSLSNKSSTLKENVPEDTEGIGTEGYRGVPKAIFRKKLSDLKKIFSSTTIVSF